MASDYRELERARTRDIEPTREISIDELRTCCSLKSYLTSAVRTRVW